MYNVPALARRILGAVAMILVAAPALHAQSAADSAAVRAVALDYALGWYDGQPERMERALHPQLAKRSVGRGPSGRDQLREMTAAQLIGESRDGVGRQVPPDIRRTDVRILDIYEGIATVRGDMHGWTDYFQMAKLDGQWKVVNVLWTLNPEFARQQLRRRPAAP